MKWIVIVQGGGAWIFFTASVNYIAAYDITHLCLSGERESKLQDEKQIPSYKLYWDKATFMGFFFTASKK